MKKLLAILLLCPVLLSAQLQYTKLMDNYLNAETSLRGFSGTVMVVKKGQTIYQKAFGQANKEWNVANTNDTKYRIGSITKQFTAACILQLEEQGKLSTDDKLSKYIPDYPKGDSITIHMLLNHTSGIKNYTDLDEFWPKAVLPLSRDSMIALFKYKPLDFTPGTKYNYSNSGYFLLGAIVEKASGKDYSDYVLNNVIRKAGLQNTFIDKLDSVLQFRAYGYDKTPDGGYQNAMFISMEGPFSAGAMVSTVSDLVKWTKALHSNMIISASSKQKMMTPYLNNYGYGLNIDSFKTHRQIGHNGGIPGFSSNCSYFPDDDLCVVTISNTGFSATRISNNLSSIMFGLPVTLPYNPKEVKIDSGILNRYTGKYKSPNPIELVTNGGKLYRRVINAPDIELKAESQTRFFYADGSDRFIEFETDKSGNPTKAWLITPTNKIELVKQ